MRNKTILLIIFTISTSIFANGFLSNLKGNKLFKNKKYTESAEEYQKGLKDNPDNASLLYNKANALYRANQFNDAIKLYDKAIKTVDNLEFKRDILLNKGNAAFRLGSDPKDPEAAREQLKGAINSYIDGLRLYPNDGELKFNLQKALVMDKRQEQQQKENEKQKNLKPSDYAKKMKKKSEKKIAQFKYTDALQIMAEAAKKDSTVMAFSDFLQRLTDVQKISP